MSEFKIKVKDVSEFVKTKLVVYATGQGKKFLVALHAAPNIKRYVVQYGMLKKGFIKKGEAVKFFNEL